MKIQLVFVTILLLGASNNPIENNPHRICKENKPVFFISIIENIWDDELFFYIRLTESEGVFFFEKKGHRLEQMIIQKAYKKGLAIELNVKGKMIQAIRKPKKVLSEAYLNTYEPVSFYHVDSLKGNHIAICDFKERVSKLFFRYAQEYLSIHKKVNPEIGCEARAGIISKFLNERLKLFNYKLFLRGRLKFRTQLKTFCWINHTINLIAIYENGFLVPYIFDPFMLKKLMPLKDYMQYLVLSGSKDLEYRIAEGNVFVCYINYKRGVLDTNYNYSKIIFSYLYQ